ncbi:MAG: hypothetical protein ABI599_01325 [Flavobacteriales bacterium]
MKLPKTQLFSVIALSALMATMPACKKKEGCTDPSALNYDADADNDDGSCTYATPSNTTTLSGSITTNTTLTADKKYLLTGFVYVEAGATLTIEPGTVIMGDKNSKGTLIVKRGAAIMAEGNSGAPIVFTSSQPAGQRAPGDWGGVVLCGKAPINAAGGEATVEGGPDAQYGGTDALDNSGVLKYVRIEFPGIALQPNQEINGLTLAAVGSGTEIAHVQVSYSGDDSFEWFGGDVNVKNLVAFGGLDDDFDMDYGFSGRGQFLVALRDPNQADASGSNGLEHDNDASGTTATPYTTPVLSNVSIYGPQATSGTSINSNFKRAAHLRRNAHSRVFNSNFAGFPTGVLIDGSLCEANCDANELKLRNCVFSAMGTLTAVASGSLWDVNAWFNANGNTSLADNSALLVADPFNLSDPNFLPNGGSPLLAGAAFNDSDVMDPFFEVTSYRGAFGDTDWTNGWCNWDPQNTNY